MSRTLSPTLILLAAFGLVLFGESCLCNVLRDKRDAYLIIDWTLNPVSCAVEGEDIRDERVETHLLVNPLGQTNDTEAIVTTCLLNGDNDSDSERGCEVVGDMEGLGTAISLRMQRGKGNSWVSEREVHDSSGACTGYIERAELTFPVTEQFRLEIRRSKWNLANPGNCFEEGPQSARAGTCTELEVLSGDFEVELFGDYESSSSGSSFDD